MGHTHRSHRTRRPTCCESLERRLLLATFIWTNRATNNFATFYGADAPLAEAIVDRALADWGRVIVNFNRTGGSNTFNLNINATTFGGTTRGSTSSILTDAQGVPHTATVRMDDNGGGAGWYFDATPGSATLPDDGEFTNLVTPFMATMPGGADFYRTVAHEICHAVGILIGGSARINQFLTNTGVRDPVDNASTLYAFNVGGGAIEATLTTAGGGHLFEGPAVPGHPEFPFHPGDLINPGRSITPPPSARQLISDLDASILELAYGYTIELPSQINTFHANLDTGSGALSVRGGAGASDDIITVDLVGGDVRMQVNGTSELFPLASVNAILIDAGDGTDVINIDETPANVGVTLAPSAGSDILNVNMDATGTALVALADTQTLGALNVGAGGRVDLTDHALVIDYMGPSPLTAVQALLTSGYSGGTWTGDGIGTALGNANTFGLGYAEATDLFTTFPASFAGETIDDTSILIRRTRYGDADLDGTTNLNDFNRLAAHFGQSETRWSQGNFNYDARTNLDDFNLLAANFGQSVPLPGSRTGAYSDGSASHRRLFDELDFQ